MKITGPAGPPTPAIDEANPPTPAAEAKEAREAERGSFAQRVATPSPVGPNVVRTERDSVSAVAADLKAGTITPRLAVDRLVDLAVARGPAADLPEAVRGKIRADLEELLRNDPYLTGRIRNLGADEE